MDTLIMYGSISENIWLDFVKYCEANGKEAILITHKSADPLPYEHRPYPYNFRLALSYPNVYHYEVSINALRQTLNAKARIYQQQYGGEIANDMLLCGDTTAYGCEAEDFGSTEWNRFI
jgi:hypothetical protein